MGAGSVYANSFVDFALNNLNVVSVIDNMRVGNKLTNNLVVSGDENLASVLNTHPSSIGVICSLSDDATSHFMHKWLPTKRPVLNMFEVMRDNS